MQQNPARTEDGYTLIELNSRAKYIWCGCCCFKEALQNRYFTRLLPCHIHEILEQIDYAAVFIYMTASNTTKNSWFIKPIFKDILQIMAISLLGFSLHLAILAGLF